MRTPSIWAVAIIVIAVVLLFGASKLPEIAGSVGKSLKIFKKEIRELREDEPAVEVPAPSAASSVTVDPPAREHR